MNSSTKISAPGISVPRGGGAIRGIGETFQPNPFSGTAGLSIPVYTSPCRGAEPRLSLEYSSGTGNGVFGTGFALSIPRISRKTDKGIPKYDDSDTFVLSGAGDLVPVFEPQERGRTPDTVPSVSVGGVPYQVLRYRPRTEGLFARIERWVRVEGGDAHWRITTRDNVTHVYGMSVQSRVADPADHSRVFSWLLEASRDRKGNQVVYEYSTDSGDDAPGEVYETNRTCTANRYIRRIRYGPCDKDGEDRWHFEVFFDYCAPDTTGEPDEISYDALLSETRPGRPDAVSSFRSGFEIRTCRLCHRIVMFHRFGDAAPFPVRAMRLGYDASPAMSFLTSVKEIGYRAGQGRKEMPPLTLTYSRTDPAFLFSLGPAFQKELVAGPISDVLHRELGWHEVSVSEGAIVSGDGDGCWRIDGDGEAYRIVQTGDRLDVYDPDRAPAFQPLTVAGGGGIPGLMDRGGHQMVDLLGEGMPGVLYTEGATVLYRRPEGEGRYGRPVLPPVFPVEHDLQAPAYSLADLGGDGKMDLVVTAPPRFGYYEHLPGGGWEGFRSFETFPSEAVRPDRALVDVTGDGLADLLIFEDEAVRVYRSRGKKGYGPPVRSDRVPGLPAGGSGSAEEGVRFADGFGDGLQHLVRIRNGSVECWPNLGYGRFGAKVTLGNAPRFEGRMDAARVFLADIDGSGTADLVYAYADRVAVFFNLSGNAFTDPVSIPLPQGYTNLDGIGFADVLGNGTSCLVLSSVRPDLSVQHVYYDFMGGQKPHLLIEVDNQMGALSRVRHAPSTQFYLADRRAGRPWATRLGFPVQVVERAETVDRVSGARRVSRYAYHDGYFDPVEREFRGFGYVERWDAESFEAAGEDTRALNTPPAYTRTWYHTGAFSGAEMLSAHYRGQYYSGDARALLLPDTILEGPAEQWDAETVREACRALHGTVLREEVYGQDCEAHPDLVAHPYAVTEKNFKVRLVQPKESRKYAACFVHENETISFHYERQPDDPRIEHTFVLEVDGYGHVLKSCRVFYPRRESPEREVYPEQQRLKATAAADRVIHLVQDFSRGGTYETFEDLCGQTDYLPGVLCEEKEYEIGGLKLEEDSDYITLGQVSGPGGTGQLDAALGNEIPSDRPFSSGPQARLDSWRRHYYWNREQDDCLTLGAVTGLALLHHTEDAVFAPGQVQRVFGNRLNDAGAQDDGGYVLGDEGYLWNPGLVESHYGADQFYLPGRTEDAFGTQTVIEYDDACLVPARIITRKSDELPQAPEGYAHVMAAEIDYYTMQPRKLTDMNDNVSEVLFDPLGMVIATSVLGTEEADGAVRRTGDGDLDGYEIQAGASFEVVLDDPLRYLDNATTFFYYDLFAWQENARPVRSIQVMRETHVSELAEGEKSKAQILVVFSDGLGRDAQHKQKADPGRAFLRDSDGKLVRDNSGKPQEGETEDRWLASGRTIYNNKGKPVKQYEPFYVSDAEYDSEAEVAEYGVTPIIDYDPLLRVVRVDTPKGFFSAVKFTPWTEIHADENDTVRDARIRTANGQILDFEAYLDQCDEDEKVTLRKTAAFYDSPQVRVLDTMGYVFLEIEDNLGRVPGEAFADLVQDRPGMTSQGVWDTLRAKGYLDENGKPTRKFQPYRAGFQLDLGDDYAGLAEPVSERLRQACLATYYERDIDGRELCSIDPRLYYANVKTGSSLYNFKRVYDMNGDVLYTDSADAGHRRTFLNVLGNPVHTWDGQGFHKSVTYDWLHRPEQVHVQDAGGGNRVAEKMIYGEELPDQPGAKNKNLRGQLVRHYDPAGVVYADLYDIGGKVRVGRRKLRRDYKTGASWGEKGGDETADEATLETEALQVAGSPVDAFRTAFRYDALERVVSETAPDGSVYEPRYNALGELRQVAVTFPGGAQEMFVQNVIYNPRGQRERITYGNGVVTTYDYERETFRLVRLRSVRNAGQAGEQDTDGEENGGRKTLQDIRYTYDPVGNVTRLFDRSHQTIFCDQSRVEPRCDYAYDALYRLIQATGREHPGLQGNEHRDPEQIKQSRFLPLCQHNTNDPQQLQNYTRKFAYDESGNLRRIRHTASESARSWTREIAVAGDSNRGVLVTDPPVSGDGTPYDAGGNLTRLDSGIGLSWNDRDELARADMIPRVDAPSDSEYYVYDSGGQRVRRVRERHTNGGDTVEMEEKVYVGGFEVKRIRQNTTPVLERHSLRVGDGSGTAAIVHFWARDDRQREVDRAGERKRLYHLDNHLGSVSLEVDEAGRVISYEEYFPFGGTALVAGKNQAEAKLKEYRYSGKERDDTTGLYYYGARYYAPWMGRWLSPDPAETVDGLNLYAFVKGNPVRYRDPEGLMKRFFNTKKGDSEKERRRKEKGKEKVNPAAGTSREAPLEARQETEESYPPAGTSSGTVEHYEWYGSPLKKNKMYPNLNLKRDTLVSMGREYIKADEGKVPYLSKEQKESIKVRKDRSGNLYRGKTSMIPLQDTRYLYAISPKGGLYIFSETEQKYVQQMDIKNRKYSFFHHSSFLRGQEVQSAGHVEVKGGKIVKIDNDSGHYRPRKEQLIEATLGLYRAGLVDENVAVHAMPKSSAEQPLWSILPERPRVLSLIEKYAFSGG